MELKPEHVDFCAELEFVHVLAGLKGVAGELEKGEGGPMRLGKLQQPVVADLIVGCLASAVPRFRFSSFGRLQFARCAAPFSFIRLCDRSSVCSFCRLVLLR